jgi:UPF0755 protein
VLLACAAGLVVGCGGEPHGPLLRVNIPSGATFAAAADSLARVGIVKQPQLFRLYAKVNGRDRDIKAGTYLLQRGTPWADLVAALEKGKGIERAVTIPEGYTLSGILPLLIKATGAPAESLEAAVRDTALRRRLDVPTENLEGYLFPDTYRFAFGTSARAAVGELVRRFEQVWQPEWDVRLQELGMSRHDVITLASIVEKEARLAEERPVIAAVYYNRLRSGMPLQADPTVQYAIGQHRERVFYKDLEVESPYNTYRNPGLPPGPIASPGRASLEAALYPANVPYRYFVAHPDGHHEFRVTFREHREARQEVRRSRRENSARRNGRARRDRRGG